MPDTVFYTESIPKRRFITFSVYFDLTLREVIMPKETDCRDDIDDK